MVEYISLRVYESEKIHGTKNFNRELYVVNLRENLLQHKLEETQGRSNFCKLSRPRFLCEEIGQALEVQ